MIMDDQTNNPGAGMPGGDQPGGGVPAGDQGGQPQGGGNDQWQPSTPAEPTTPEGGTGEPAPSDPATTPTGDVPHDGGAGTDQNGGQGQAV
jgi:hypothetical protein